MRRKRAIALTSIRRRKLAECEANIRCMPTIRELEQKIHDLREAANSSSLSGNSAIESLQEELKKVWQLRDSIANPPEPPIPKHIENAQSECESEEAFLDSKRRERAGRTLVRRRLMRSKGRTKKQTLIDRARKFGPLQDHVQCYLCNRLVSIRDVHVEHKRPLIRGGSNSARNLALACPDCNLAKGRLTVDEFVAKKRP